ncbi:right-handed parallel beta-helix repeat-containing protein [Haloferula sp.]|uniref:right-handed parallel beta-helix repeat-containing protein n=1 Tax=Haloferula sp. TaxID=2497595 RepID=UPI003C7077C9
MQVHLPVTILAVVGGLLAAQGAELIVSSTLDSGPGSLRQAITNAAPGDTILFASDLNGKTINLSSDQILIDKELRIDASRFQSGITIARSLAAPRFRLLEIGDGKLNTKLRVSIQNVAFKNGISPLGGAILNSEDLELTDCEFANNRASGVFPDGRGGALLNQAGSISALTRVTFEGNIARNQGAGIANLFSQSSAIECTFIENSSQANAGAIFNEGASPMLVACLFLGNEALGYGGAILNLAGSSPELTNCLFSKNRSTGEVGGGSAIFNLNASHPHLINCTFSGNLVAADMLGGAIYNAGSQPVLKNCILWGNNSGILGDEPDPDSGFNLVEGDPGSEDPQFVREPGSFGADDYGDLRLLATSPAINAGDGGPGSSMNSSVEDAKGQPRFLDDRIDLGAYEGENRLDFNFFFAGLNPHADDNRNGLSNFVDYAAGADPRAPHDTRVNPSISGQQVSFSYRSGTQDVLPSFQKSQNLIDWRPLVEGVDYSGSLTTTIGSRTIVRFNIIPAASPGGGLFYRTEFQTAPP